jgi:hypothetical protein
MEISTKNQQSKTILLYNPYNIWPFHLETELEIVNAHHQLGNRLIVLVCNGEINPCDQLLDEGHSCSECIHRREYGYKHLRLARSVQFRTAINLSETEQKEISTFIQNLSYGTLAQLKSIRYDEFDLGMAVAASLISHLREPYPFLAKHRALTTKLLTTTLQTYLSVQKHLVIENVSTAYIFNGRLSVLRAAYRACQQLGVQVFIHERAGVMNKYSLAENTTPHDLQWWKEQIEHCWTSSLSTHEAKVALGHKWFNDRANGQDQGWSSFSKEFIPAISSASQKGQNQFCCAIFLSSEDEMETIQFCALTRIFKDLTSNQAYHFIVRVHPNLRNVHNSQTKGIDLLKRKYPKVIFVDADNSASSYDIAIAADLVLVFGSTIGIEAAYLGKKVVLIGHAFYESLNVCTQINSHDHLIAVLIKCRHPEALE